MDKRKFNANRLYKLIKLLVIGIALLSGVLGLFTMRGVQTNYTDERIKKSCSDYDIQYVNECELSYYRTKDSFIETIIKEFEIAIGLPLVFFGGVGLYRYIFPKAKETKEKRN